MRQIDQDFVRKNIPGLSDEVTFFDNAGGAQVAVLVVDRIRDFLIHRNVQLGASYGTSQAASAAVAEGRAALAMLMNAARPKEVVVGATEMRLLDQLARGWRPQASRVGL
jgi:selenocysteine lyase/cysteine desulfurase